MISMLRRLIVASALLLFGTQGCNSDALPPAASYSSISGVVVDAATNSPIHGAIVTIDTVMTATSDDTGHFTFDKVPSGIADYAASATGYKTLESSATLEPGKPFTLNLTLSAQPAPPH